MSVGLKTFNFPPARGRCMIFIARVTFQNDSLRVAFRHTKQRSGVDAFKIDHEVKLHALHNRQTLYDVLKQRIV